jgi:predicted MFS family arabinose efflux permease
VVGAEARRLGFDNVVRVLRIRNYRTYTTGNVISLVGTWIQRIAVGWLAWQLTHSGSWLGLCAAADLVPTVVISPFAGALADRADRVRVIWFTQLFAMLQAGLLAWLAYGGGLGIETLFLLTLALGILNAVNQPARLALIPSLVDRDTLAAAVAMNSLVFNCARFIGPATAGFAIAHGSVALAFLLNALSYVAFLVALARVTVAPAPPTARQDFVRQSVEGYLYALRHPGIGRMMALFAVTSVALRGFIELFPGFADGVFGKGPQGLAWLTATVGIGAMVGGFFMLRRQGVQGLTGLIVNHTLVMALAVVGFTSTDVYWLALPCVFVAGFSLVVTGISAQTLVQTAVDPAMRGRVMGLYGMLFRAGPALNALLMGSLSSSLGLHASVASGAVFCLAAWGWAAARRPAMAAALETDPSGAPAE